MRRVKILPLALAILASSMLFVVTTESLALSGRGGVIYGYTELLKTGGSQAQSIYIPAPTPIPNATVAPAREIMLCPLEVKVAIVNSTHSYKYANPQRVLINAKKGDVISIVLKASLDPNLLSCVRDALNLRTVGNIHVEYGLKLGSEGLITVEPGVKSMNISNTELKDLGGGLYKLTITIGNDTEPGTYRVEFTAYTKLTGDEIDFTVMAQHAIHLDIR